MIAALQLALVVLALPLLIASAYLALLALCSRRGPVPAPAAVLPFIHFVVPAHDEEAGIAGTVESLLALDYPQGRFRVLVVADNCADQTAARARAAGAAVLVRDNLEQVGKGYALELAFETLLSEGPEGAAAVVDADTVVSPNLARAFAARLDRGAAAVQADYGVRNPQASWRTRLMAIALAMFHVLRSLGRERLGLSCGLRGNGMCFTTALLREIPHRAFSLVEDVEYGLRLGQAGHRVHYAAEAQVLGEMVSTEKASRSQRQRWENGRRALVRTLAPGLLESAFARRDPVLLDLLLDLLVPPLATLAALVAVGLGCAVLLSVRLHAPSVALFGFAASAACLALYVARGWQLSGTGARGLLDLAFAGAYLPWKLSLLLRRGRKGAWVRTEREDGGGDPRAAP